MPWSSGVFTRDNGTFTGERVWQKDQTAATKITASNHDTHDQDLADGINSCLNKDGSNAMTGNLDMGGFNVSNAGNIITGTFTPTLTDSGGTGTFSYTTRTAGYTLVGDMVFVNILVKGSWLVFPNAADRIRVSTNLGYTASFDSKLNVAHANVNADSDLSCEIASGTGYFELGAYTTNGSISTITWADRVTDSSWTVNISGTFIKA